MASVPYMYIGLCAAVYSLCTDFLSAGTSNDFACLASVSSLYLGLLVFYLFGFSATAYGLCVVFFFFLRFSTAVL